MQSVEWTPPGGMPSRPAPCWKETDNVPEVPMSRAPREEQNRPQSPRRDRSSKEHSATDRSTRDRRTRERSARDRFSIERSPRDHFQRDRSERNSVPQGIPMVGSSHRERSPANYKTNVQNGRFGRVSHPGNFSSARRPPTGKGTKTPDTDPLAIGCKAELRMTLGKLDLVSKTYGPDAERLVLSAVQRFLTVMQEVAEDGDHFERSEAAQMDGVDT